MKEMRAAVWNECVVQDERIPKDADMAIRSIADLQTGAKVLVDDILFEGLDILRCHEGRFRFSFRDHEPVELVTGEALILYPGRYVTIEALDARNRIVYGVFDGRDAEDCFDALGFFDFARGPTAAHLGSIAELRRLVGETSASGRFLMRKDAPWKSLLADILASQAKELRAAYPALVFDALNAIQANLRQGVVRIAPLCRKLKVSRVYLNQVFVKAGLGSPSEVIRELQVRRAVRLLRDSQLEIAEVAGRTGFVSAAHFATFIRKKTGQTPTALRRGSSR